MTTPDVPTERGRDQLREKLRHLTRDPGPLGSAVCALLKAAEAEVPVMVMPDESRAILDMLAVVREAPPISDTAVARIIEAVEAHCGMGHGAWDMVAARDLVEGFAAALGADTRRIDALEARGSVELVQNADGTWDIDPDPDLHARFPSLRAAIDSVLLPTAPGAPEEGAGE